MRLSQHRDFDQAILRAAEHFRSRGLRAAIIEKDYYVTEALRQVALTAGDHLIFKGGTSLSKGWGLIERFSEDIDLFLDPLSFATPPGKKLLDRKLKELRDAVARCPGLTHLADESRTLGAIGRNDHFAYEQRFATPGEVRNRVLLETGTASGREPSEQRTIRSYLAQFLGEAGITLGADDEQPFPMRLLHFRRTFVEKLFAIHGKVERLKRDGTPLGSYVRHYYDLHQLAGRAEILAMLRSTEYRDIQADYDQISRRHFARDYCWPEAMDFRQSDALFPPTGLSSVLGAEYARQCDQLCYGPYPSWQEVMSRFGDLRGLLAGS